MRTISMLLMLRLFCSPLLAAEPASDIKMFPAAGEKEQRVIIRVPQRANEADSKVEVMIGLKQAADCNQRRISGDLQEINLKGWGYSYYRLEKMGPMISTRMACPPGSKNKSDTIPVIGKGYLLRYNSRLPIVIYAPKELEVRYRFWHADTNSQLATKE